jgi:hypothetical protein
MRLTRLVGLIVGLVVLSTAAAPAALAWGGGRHAGWNGGFGGRHRGHIAVVPAPLPAPIVPVPFPVAPAVQPVPVPVAQPVPVPVPAPVQAAILPPLQQLLPGAGFAQNPPQVLPLQGNTYAVSSPVLFCSVDQVGTCQLLAQELAQVTPGWGTTIMNGPQGYGVYLTYQPA